MSNTLYTEYDLNVYACVYVCIYNLNAYVCAYVLCM